MYPPGFSLVHSGAGVPARLPATSRHSPSRERGLPAHAGKAGRDARPTEKRSPRRYFRTLDAGEGFSVRSKVGASGDWYK
jgi:hypothetical protein